MREFGEQNSFAGMLRSATRRENCKSSHGQGPGRCKIRSRESVRGICFGCRLPREERRGGGSSNAVHMCRKEFAEEMKVCQITSIVDVGLGFHGDMASNVCASLCLLPTCSILYSRYTILENIYRDEE